MMNPERVAITLDRSEMVSGLLLVPPDAVACFVLAHGAGASMTHGFLEAMAMELAERGIATLRFQFPFMERGSRRPDPAPVAQRAVRAAVEAAARLLPDVPLMAGGRSFGGRMASQAQAELELAQVRGLAFLGFPLHPAKRPSAERARTWRTLRSQCSSSRAHGMNSLISITCGRSARGSGREPLST